MQDLIDNVREGKVPMALDRPRGAPDPAAEVPPRPVRAPVVDRERAAKSIHARRAPHLALEAAREGIVLLKNEKNLLPLQERQVDRGDRAQCGRRTEPARRLRAEVILQDIVTVLEGIKRRSRRGTEVQYVKGCDVAGEELNEIAQAQEAARKADVAIVVVGESLATGSGRPTARATTWPRWN